MANFRSHYVLSDTVFVIRYRFVITFTKESNVSKKKVQFPRNSNDFYSNTSMLLELQCLN